MYLFLVLTAAYLSSSAQSRIEVIGTDTFAVLPLGQLRTANVKFVELKQCREENDSLFSQVRTFTGLANNLKASITDLKEAHRLSEAIIADKQKIIDISDQQLKKAARKARILKLERNSLAGALLILGAKILFFK